MFDQKQCSNSSAESLLAADFFLMISILQVGVKPWLIKKGMSPWFY